MFKHEKPPEYIRDVPRFFKEFLYFKRLADIRDYVEYPLIAACIIFWQNNILTTWTTANKTDKEAILKLDYPSLSPVNKTIADVARLKMDINPGTLVSQVESHFVAEANKFHHQKATWIPRYTIQEAQETFQSLAYTVGPGKIRTLRTEGQFIKLMIAEAKGYYSKEDKYFYMSYEHYQKYHDQA